jgi:hypothetical protein
MPRAHPGRRDWMPGGSTKPSKREGRSEWEFPAGMPSAETYPAGGRQLSPSYPLIVFSPITLSKPLASRFWTALMPLVRIIHFPVMGSSSGGASLPPNHSAPTPIGGGSGASGLGDVGWEVMAWGK